MSYTTVYSLLNIQATSIRAKIFVYGGRNGTSIHNSRTPMTSFMADALSSDPTELLTAPNYIQWADELSLISSLFYKQSTPTLLGPLNSEIINKSNQIRHKVHIQQCQQLIPLLLEEVTVPPSVVRNNKLQPKQPPLNPSPSAYPRKQKHLMSAT